MATVKDLIKKLEEAHDIEYSDAQNRINQLWHSNQELIVRCSKLQENLTKADQEWYAKLQAADAELAEASHELEVLKDGRILTCAYCGHAYGPDTPASQSDLLYEHIASCPQHPMTSIKAELDKVIQENKDAAGLLFKFSYTLEEVKRFLQAGINKTNSQTSAGHLFELMKYAVKTITVVIPDEPGEEQKDA